MEDRRNWNEIFREELPFVPEETWQIRDLYHSLLFSARSKRHLCKMHNELLPCHWRLLKKDLVVLVKFWEKHYAEGLKDRSLCTPEKYVAYIMQLRNQANPAGLAAYYKEKLNEGRTVYKDFREEVDANFVYPSIKQTVIGAADGMGTQEFFLKLAKGKLQMEFLYGKGKLQVRCFIWEHDLTEPFTYVLSNLPVSTISHLQSGYRGSQVDFCFTFEATWLEEFLGPVDVLDPKDRNRLYIADGRQIEFCEQLKVELAQIGVPVKAIKLSDVQW